MISWKDLDQLMEREAQPGSPVLSVYLDVDQSRATNLNRQFQAALKNMLQSIERELHDKEERREFNGDSDRVMRSVSSYEPHGRSLVIFCDESAGLYWQRDLNASLRNDAQWTETAYVRPLVEALDEFERYGVILTDRAQARIFTIYLPRPKKSAASPVLNRRSSLYSKAAAGDSFTPTDTHRVAASVPTAGCCSAMGLSCAFIAAVQCGRLKT